MRCCGPRGSGRGRAEGLGGRGASGQPRTAGALGGPWVGAGAQLRRLTARDGAAGRSGEDRARQDPGGRPSSHGSRSSHGGRTAGAAGGGARPRPPVPCTPVQGLGRVDQSWRLAPQPPNPTCRLPKLLPQKCCQQLAGSDFSTPSHLAPHPCPRTQSGCPPPAASMHPDFCTSLHREEQGPRQQHHRRPSAPGGGQGRPGGRRGTAAGGVAIANTAQRLPVRLRPGRG